MQIIDLSHSMAKGMVTDPRLPAVEVEELWTRESSAARYAPGVSFQIASVSMPQNSGTYVDCPFHRHEGMPGTWDYPLDRLVNLPVCVIDARGAGRRLGPELFADRDVLGHAVLFWTAWDENWGTQEYGAGGHPFLTAAGADALVQRGALLFGVDAINADDFADKSRPAHSILLGAGATIVENLTNLSLLAAGAKRRGAQARFFAAPLKIEGFGSCPIRAFAIVD